MKVIGITGGIGSGKSTVSKTLEIMGIPVYNSDIEAKKITASSLVIKEKLIKRFGSSIYKNNTLDKKLLAHFIFNDQSALSYVNSVIHPEVFNDFLKWKDRFRKEKIIGIESAILFESGLNKLNDFILSVSAPKETKIERVIQRDKLKKEEILERINNQISEKERNELADYTIINDNIQAIIPQIEIILSNLNFQEFA